MLFELIAAVVAGVAVAGIAMGLRWISRGLLPKWIVPAMAGLGMLAYAIWSEYSWYARMTASQPSTFEVVWLNEASSLLRPWSFYKPVINRFTGVDLASAQRHPNFPDQVMVDLILAARWQSPARVKVVFDCAAHRRADLMGKDVSIADNGEITGATWVDIPADDKTLEAACRSS